MNSKPMLSLTVLALCLPSAPAAAREWVEIRSPAELRALYSDKTWRGKGADGVPFVGHYRADGTGVMIRAGVHTPRTWEVKGPDQACVTDTNGTNCYRFQRHKRDRGDIVGQHVTEHWIFQVTVEDGVPGF
jgi:hypothetical protein